MARAPSLLLWLLLALAVLLPAADVLAHLHLTPIPIPTSTDFTRLARGVASSIAIALLASALALPVAWSLRTTPGATWPFLGLLIPNYLAYAACQRLIAPGSAIGDLLARGPVSGDNWWPLAAAHTLAVVALAAWSWPLAFIIQREAFARLDASLLSALRLDAPRLRRARCVLSMGAPALAAGAALVALVTLGSAVPLHLAQVDSYALSLWTRLSLASPAELPSVWLAAWPCVLLALTGAAALTHRIFRPAEPALPARHHPRRTLPSLYLLILVGAPLLILSGELRDAHAFTRFWRLHADAAAESLLVALTVALLAATASGLCWAACAWTRRARSRALQLLFFAAFAWALMPGTLVGQAWASLSVRFWCPPALADSPLPVVLAQFGRVLPVALVAGLALARAEAPLRDLRLLDDACRPRAIPCEAGGLVPLVLGAGGACLALSLHEIEATIMVQPPGHDSLARRMLEMLHYQRMEMLGAGVLLLTLAAGAVALVAGWGLRARAR